MQDDAIPTLEVVVSADGGEQPKGPPGNVQQWWHDDAGRLVAFGGTTPTGWWMHWPGLGAYEFGAAGPVRVSVRSSSQVEAARDTFVRGVLPVVLLARDREVLHGSAVATDRGVAVFCGRSGTGKSSLALGLARSGRRQWADDSVALELSESSIDVSSLPFPSRVDDSALDALTGAGQPADAPAQPGDRAPLAAVYLMSRDPSLDPASPSIQRLPPVAAFQGLLAHVHPFELADEGRRRRTIERWLTVAALVPVFELRFAPSLAALPAFVARVDEHLSKAE